MIVTDVSWRVVMVDERLGMLLDVLDGGRMLLVGVDGP
jgi:hypothetical protein